MRSERLARLRSSMAEQGVDALVLLHGPHVAYATGFVPPAVDVTHAVFERAVAVVTAERVRLHVPRAGQAVDAAGVVDGAEVAPPVWPELDEAAPAFAASLAEMLDGLGGRRVGVDEITGAMNRAGVLDGAEVVDAGKVLGPARLQKTDDELACMDLAQRINEEAMEATREAAVPGARRSEVAGTFLRRLAELGGRPHHIDPIFERIPKDRSTGPRTSTGHIAFPTGVGDPVLAEGDLVWVDTGIDVHGYMSDFGRTWVVGRDPTPDEQALFERWRAVVAAALDATKPGATLGDVCRAATEVEGGERPWLPHFYLAHGLGVESAEPPMAGTDLGQAFDDRYILAPGMVLVFEPVVWEDGLGGYRAEEVVAVTDDGWRLLGGGYHYLPFAA
jgi:Xaa-Pro aminopeptidase